MKKKKKETGKNELLLCKKKNFLSGNSSRKRGPGKI